MKSRRIGYARLNRGSNPAITDTELQLMRFKIPSTPLNLSSTLLPLSPSLDPVNVSLQTVNSKTIISLPPLRKDYLTPPSEFLVDKFPFPIDFPLHSITPELKVISFMFLLKI